MASDPPRASIDLIGPGKRLGHLDLSWSDDERAYGVIPVPIAVIRGGDGPTALVTAGVHGDEYEGLVIARRLLAQIEPSAVPGRIIVMAGVNGPAVEARTRVSPIDRQNMNRAFAEDVPLGPTRLIARFIEERLLPTVDVAMDLHSGGTQSIYTPCGYLYEMGDAAFRARKLAAAHAFGAPHTACVAATASGGSLSSACERAGIPMVATELGGGARLDRDALAIGWEGTLNLLRHAGVLAGAPRPTRTRLTRTDGRPCFAMAPIDGLFESRVAPGDAVTEQDVAGVIWPMDDPAREPVPVTVPRTGVLLCCRTMPMVKRGDFLFHTGREIGDADFLQTPP